MIDGVTVPSAVAPADAQQTAEILADSSSRGEGVIPTGGGTALGLGNIPERADLLLSTECLNGIIDYEPTDLVLSVGAGAKLGDVQAVLGEHGQRLPIDPPGGDEATIGGLIATARWGPLRYGSGTLRDLLIGISVAHPSGTVSKAGGMVVKNVSGYDMPRLYLGSLGTLGVITSANFKVLPRPRAEATVLAHYDAAEIAFQDATVLHSGREPIAALEVLRRDGAWSLAARTEGREQTVEAVTSRIATGVRGNATRIPGGESVSWWRDYVAQWQVAGDRVVTMRCAVRPRNTVTLATGLVAALENLGLETPFVAASPGIGSVLIAIDLGETGSAERLAEIQSLVLGLADTAAILSAPPAWKSGIDVWGRKPEGFAVMQSLREEFDPRRSINPGRFAGFL